MTFNPQIIPKELLKFRLNKQLSHLQQIFTNFPFSANEIIDSYSGEEEGEDKFQLYQRVLSWFIMGRLAKSEYDAILENILLTSELIELHNKVIELLRAIYCDSGVSSGSNTTNLISAMELDGDNSNLLTSFAYEFSLLPLEEANIPEKASDEPNSALLESGPEDISIPPASTPFFSNPKIKEFNTSIENLNLTSTEEALISEALRNPIHELATNEIDSQMNYRKSFDIFTGNHRFCTEISSLPDQNFMKQRFLKIASNYTEPNTGNILSPVVSDSIAVLACKALEDHMKNIMENLVTLKSGRQPLLRPPISYIFSNEKDQFIENKIETTITLDDLILLFRLKPWLLADMETFLESSFE